MAVKSSLLPQWKHLIILMINDRGWQGLKSSLTVSFSWCNGNGSQRLYLFTYLKPWGETAGWNKWGVLSENILNMQSEGGMKDKIFRNIPQETWYQDEYYEGKCYANMWTHIVQCTLTQSEMTVSFIFLMYLVSKSSRKCPHLLFNSNISSSLHYGVLVCRDIWELPTYPM